MDSKKEITESNKGAGTVVAPQEDAGTSGGQPNWTWGRQDTNHKKPPYNPNLYKLPQKSGWDKFWEFIGIGIFATVCNFLIRSCQ